MRNNKGVTLVALVITIIVLLILAGVSLAMLTGDSGILTNADEAKKATAVANAKSAIEMTYMDIKTEIYAREAQKTTAQTVEVTGEELEAIAARYIKAADATITGEGSITADTTDEDSDKVTLTINFKDQNVDVKGVITYDPTSTTGRVSIVWEIPGEDSGEAGDDTTGGESNVGGPETEIPGEDSGETGDDTTGGESNDGGPESEIPEEIIPGGDDGVLKEDEIPEI